MIIYLSDFEKGVIHAWTGPMSVGARDYQRFGPEAYLAQGVFVMHNIRSKNVMTEVFQIKKLRGQKFPKTMMPYSIGKSGVEVYPEEKVFI